VPTVELVLLGSVALLAAGLITFLVLFLVARHRLVPGQAFDRLRSASQNRNLKLREVARRVIETGLEPEEA
jgi:hypothetical protein